MFLMNIKHFYVVIVLTVAGKASDETKCQGPTKPFHRPRAIPPNLNCNSTSSNSSPNTPRSHPSFASLKADAELPDVTSEQAAATAAIKLVLFIFQ